MSEIKIRRADLSDAPAIARVHVETWQLIYGNLLERSHLDSLSIAEREKKWRETLAKTGQAYIVFVVENEAGDICGFANFGVPDRERPRDAELYAIYLHPDYHGQKMGSALFRACRAEVKKMSCNRLFCWVFKAFVPGHEFYRHMGGRLDTASEKQLVVGERPYAIVSYEWVL